VITKYIGIFVRLGWNFDFTKNACVSHVVEMITNSN